MLDLSKSILHTSAFIVLLRDAIGMPPATMAQLLPSNPLPPDATPPTTQAPIATCSPLPKPTPSQAKDVRRRRRRVHRPTVDSLYDLMNQHAGTSLFVRPICWTDIHTQVLGAKFEELPACDAPLPTYIAGSPPSKGHMQPSKTITAISDSLTEMLHPSSPFLGSRSVRTVLATFWPTTFEKIVLMPDFNLFFGGRVYRDTVRVQAMWNFTDETPRSTSSSLHSFDSVTTRPAESFEPSRSRGHSKRNRPMMCYIGRHELAAIRKNLFRVSGGPDKSNEPVFRLQQLRAKALIPANADHDAHLVGIFLAMAQRHFYSQPKGRGPRNSKYAPPPGEPLHPTFEDVTLRIMTTDADNSDFLVYTAHVSAAFLERFDKPCRTPRSDEGKAPGIHIEYTRVPIWPILGLKERLGRALGEDLVGPINMDKIERWEDPEEKVEEDAEVTGSASKRKREALVEVFNSSFEEESDNEPAVSAKKRCLSERSPLGIVI